MKRQYLIFFYTILLLSVCGCGKKENPAPGDNDGDNNSGPTNPPGGTVGGSFSIEANFKAPTGFSTARAAVQPDGKIIIDSYVKVNNQNVIKIYRLNTNGSVDNSFNIDVDKTWIIKSISGLFLLADGKVLVAGEFTLAGQKRTLVRLSASGALDTAYVPPFIPVNSVFQRTADGKVFASYAVARGYSFDLHADAHIVRLNNDGSLDNSFAFSTFDQDGTLPDRITSIVPLINGNIFISGVFTIGTGTATRQNVVRVNANGVVDNDFNFKEIPRALAVVEKIGVQTNGKVILVGNFNAFTDPNIRDATYNYTGVARLNTDGTIDQSFKTANSFTYSSYINSIVLLSDDRILLNWIGISNNSYYNKSYLELFAKDGGVDASFNFPYQYNGIVNILKESADRFFLMGTVTVDGINYPIVRYKK